MSDRSIHSLILMWIGIIHIIVTTNNITEKIFVTCNTNISILNNNSFFIQVYLFQLMFGIFINYLKVTKYCIMFLKMINNRRFKKYY